MNHQQDRSPHIFTGSDKDTEPLSRLRTAGGKPTGTWPMQPQNPADRPDYYKKLGAQNDEAMLRELRMLSSGVLALVVIAALWLALSVVSVLFFYHALTTTIGTTVP